MIENTNTGKYISKNFWEDILSSPLPCLYMKVYKQSKLINKDQTLRTLYTLFVKDKIIELSKKLGKKMMVVDWLSAYGNCLLIMLYDLDPNKIYELLETEEKAINVKNHITRSFQCETVAIDILESPLNYGKNQNFFDKTFLYNINKIFEEKENYNTSRYYMKNGNLMYLGSACYIDDRVFFQLIDWFCEGEEEGYLFLSFSFPLDVVERNNILKCYLINRCEFVGSLPGQHRELFPNEENYKNKYGATVSYQETWCVKRKLIKSVS
jgi:hypothetical protein